MVHKIMCSIMSFIQPSRLSTNSDSKYKSIIIMKLIITRISGTHDMHQSPKG